MSMHDGEREEEEEECLCQEGLLLRGKYSRKMYAREEELWCVRLRIEKKGKRKEGRGKMWEGVEREGNEMEMLLKSKRQRWIIARSERGLWHQNVQKWLRMIQKRLPRQNRRGGCTRYVTCRPLIHR